MLATERQVKILSVLNNSGFVSVEELEQVLSVSAMTIRRDLEKLGRLGQLNRCHGGAVQVGMIREEEAYDRKQIYRLETKRKIAQACVRLVGEGDIVFLDAGTTTYEVATLIQGIKGITVVTLDIKIACLLLCSPVKLIIIGGVVQKETGSVLGQFAEEMLGRLRVKVAFIGTSSIDEEFNLMTPTMEKSATKIRAITMATKAYLVADAGKFYKTALVKVVNLSQFAGIITDKPFSPAETKILEDKDIEIIQV